VVVLRTTFTAGVLTKLTVGVGGRGDGVTGPPRPTLLLPPSSLQRLSLFARTPGLLFPTFFSFLVPQDAD
jgi:hypothetical protein